MADIPRKPEEVETILAEDRFLRSLAAGLLGPGPDADDAAQHAWLRSLEHPPKRRGALRAFLGAVLKNRVRDSMRDEGRRARHEQAAARPEAVPSAEEMASQEELRRTVGDAVLALDEPYRATVWLRFREQLPPREVARRMGVPVETVRTRSRRALEELRRKLDRSYGDRQAWVRSLVPLVRGPLKATAASLPWGGALTGALAMKKILAVVPAALLVVAALGALLATEDLRVAEEARARSATHSGALGQLDRDQPDDPPMHDMGAERSKQAGEGVIDIRTPSSDTRTNAPNAPLGPSQKVTALPEGLLALPAGTVHLGQSARSLYDIAEQTQPVNLDQRVIDLKNTLSELGSRTADIEPFLLGEFPVTNQQYRGFVEATGHRFPFHWWRYGDQEDYNQRLPEISEEFPDERELGPFLYWERHFKELPWKLEDETGKDIGNQPVTFVSWRDAMAYAAWAGMRLPTEEEWTYAARGTGRAVWVWGENRQSEVGDEYLPGILDELSLQGTQTLEDVGATGPAGRGAFGHGDLVGQVWEWTATRFGPLTGQETFDAEFVEFKEDQRYAKLPAERRQEHLSYPPQWQADRFVIKGGSYFSASNPIELHIDARHRLPSTENLAGAGFRVAKSLQPGRDAASSLIQTEYDLSVFPGKRAPNLSDQIGVERYEVNDNGFIDGYHTVSLVPANFLREGRAPNPVEEDLRMRPEVVATLVTTEKLSSPPLEPGLYSVYYRPPGKPLDRYGIKESELEGQAAPDKTNYIRLNPGELTVPTDRAQFILRDNQGVFRAAMETLRLPAPDPGYKAASIKVDDVDGLERFTVVFGVPLVKGDPDPLVFELSLVLTTVPDRSWRR